MKRLSSSFLRRHRCSAKGEARPRGSRDAGPEHLIGQVSRIPSSAPAQPLVCSGFPSCCGASWACRRGPLDMLACFCGRMDIGQTVTSLHIRAIRFLYSSTRRLAGILASSCALCWPQWLCSFIGIGVGITTSGFICSKSAVWVLAPLSEGCLSQLVLLFSEILGRSSSLLLFL